MTSLRRALGILGDPWTMLILKEAFNGTRRFSEFQRSLSIPKQTLSLRLTDLCRNQMFYRRYVNANAGTALYQPTAKTYDLHQAMYAIWLWHKHNPATVNVLPFDLVHTKCGNVLSATYSCRLCGEPATKESLTIQHSDPIQYDDGPRPRQSRRNDGAIIASQAGGQPLVAASVIGDIPCNEILYSLFQKPNHLLALARDLQIGPHVVRDRLEKLTLLGMIEKSLDGRKSVYSTLPKSDQFLPLILSISEWGDRWCNEDAPPPESRVHSCGNLLEGRMRCDHCDEFITQSTIKVIPHSPETIAPVANSSTPSLSPRGR